MKINIKEHQNNKQRKSKMEEMAGITGGLNVLFHDYIEAQLNVNLKKW